MHSTNSTHLSVKLVDETGLRSVSISEEVAVEAVIELEAQRDDPPVQLNDYNVSKKNFEQKVSEQEFVVSTSSTSLKYLEKYARSLASKNNLLI